MSVRGLFRWSVAALGILVLASAASMVLLTTFLRTGVSALERAMLRSAAAERIEGQLLLLDLQTVSEAEGRVPSIAAVSPEDLQATLDELGALVYTERGKQLVQELRERVDAYLAARGKGRTQAGLLEAALQACRSVKEFGKERATEATQQAARLDRLGNILAVVMALLFAAVSVVSVALTRRQFYRPLSELTEAIERFGKGERSSRAPAHGALELSLIASTFNATADMVERQLVSMASVAHDLRSPLNALGVAVGALRPEQPLPDEEKLRRIGGLASKQIAKLDRMISDLLDRARMETGHIELHPRECDLREIAADSLELFRATAAGHELVLVLPQEPVRVSCDPLRMEQALNNLVSNAIKYSPAGGRVQVEVGSDASEAWVAVRDQGIGIAADQRERVFEPFRRSGRPREEIPGVGLGLSITKRIAESHGGRLELESAIGKGSTFRLVLPFAQPSHSP